MTSSIIFTHAAVKDSLGTKFVGKILLDVPTPAAILDTLGDAFTSKLISRDGTGPANIVVSTNIEAERIVPLLLKRKNAGRAVNILCSFPVSPSTIARLAAISKLIGPSGLPLLTDHSTQLSTVYAIAELSGRPPVYIKIDMGCKRVGVHPQSPASSQLISDFLSVSNVLPPSARFHGFYSHAGQSHGGSSRATSIDYLRLEQEALYVVAAGVTSAIPGMSLVLSVGATPATATRNLLVQDFGDSDVENMAISSLKGTIETIGNEKQFIEIYAEGPNSMLGWSDLTFTVIAEVPSLYPGRGMARGPEALVGVGSLDLGRELCKAYGGWGIVSPWKQGIVLNSDVGPEFYKGWIVRKISQEHGILCWSGDAEKAVPGTGES